MTNSCLEFLPPPPPLDYYPFMWLIKWILYGSSSNALDISEVSYKEVFNKKN